MAEEFLGMSKISKSFVGVQALDAVDFSINKGEIHCLVGENGSGKSTLIKIISGVEQPDAGEIRVEGRRIENIHSIDSIRRGIEVIYQDMSLFPNLPVAENISVNQTIESGQQIIRWPHLKNIAREAIAKIGISLDLDELVGNLSIARQQLVAICRALTSDVRLLIMDEPTTALTKKEIDLLFSVVKGLQRKGIAIMFVSHKLNEILQIAERVTVLRDGKNAGTLAKHELTNEKLIMLMTGTKIESSRFVPQKLTQNVLLEVKHLSKRNNFKEISFTLYQGEILGITGLLGSGRTELALALFGMNRADAGEIYVNGKLQRIRSVQDAVKLGISYVPENRLVQGLIMPQSVDNNVVMTVIQQLLGRLKLIDNGKRHGLVQKWVKELGIKVFDLGSPVQNLSGGNQQRVVIAKWLATNPQILILDGPTVGIDIAAKSSIHSMIRDLANSGVGIILISDEVPEVMNNCHRILLMKNGRIINQFDTSKVTEEAIQTSIESS